MIGETLGHYRILEKIGQGGMGEVFLAEDTSLHRKVALKFLPHEMQQDAAAHKRFLREARSAAALDHPFICHINEVAESDGQDFIVMEYVDGQSLKDRLVQGLLSPEDALQITIEVSEALEAAHAKGIIHRDIKPTNIMLTQTGHAKVMDFGLAKQLSPSGGIESQEETITALTADGTTVGTLAYMSPEQLRSQAADARSDIWALGVTLYEMAAGARPFHGQSGFELTSAIMSQAPRPLPSHVPAELGAVIERCLEKEPEKRYQQAGDVRAALEAIQAGTAAPRAAWRYWLRGHCRLMLAAALVIIAAGLGWFGLTRWTQPAFAFKERDFVLVADVENGTGEAVFDLALKSALEIGLRQSRYVNVLDSNQVRNALRMMRLNADTSVTPEVGRDLCRRVGAPALLAPRILRAGDAYQIEVALVEVSTGRVVDAMQETARGREEVLLHTIDNLTRQLRSRLGESMASLTHTSPPFAQYTTSSLEALQLLELGRRAWMGGDFATAERSFGAALQLDPRFAAARGSLGLILIQFLNRPDEGRKMLAQAMQEEGNVSEREYLSLRAVNKQFVAEDLQGALDDYRFMSKLYPDLMPPYNNSGQILEKLGRLREAAAMYERASKADLQNPIPLQNLWFLAIRRLKDPALAERTARTLVELMPENAGTAHNLAWTLVAERRFVEAEDAMRATLKLDPSHAYALPNLGHLQFRRGDAADAVATYQQLLKLAGAGNLKTDLEHAWLSLGLAQAAAGQAAEARRTLLDAVEKIRSRNEPIGPDLEGMTGCLLAAAGRRDEARLLAMRLARKAAGNIDINYELARIWALLGDTKMAIHFLNEAFAAGYTDTYMILIDPPLASVKNDPAISHLAPYSFQKQ